MLCGKYFAHIISFVLYSLIFMDERKKAWEASMMIKVFQLVRGGGGI